MRAGSAPRLFHLLIEEPLFEPPVRLLDVFGGRVHRCEVIRQRLLLLIEDVVREAVLLGVGLVADGNEL